MKADEAAELIHAEHEGERFKHYSGIVIAIFAMLLAVTGLGGQNATKEAINSNILASNLYSFYQAKNQRQTAYAIAADTFELGLVNDQTLPESARAAIKAKAEQFRRTVARYDSEPDTQEGKKELLARAKAEDEKRDRALRQDPYFDFSETFLQIAIVLISVSMISNQRFLAYGGGVLGVLGAFLMVNGFLLLVRIPMLE